MIRLDFPHVSPRFFSQYFNGVFGESTRKCFAIISPFNCCKLLNKILLNAFANWFTLFFFSINFSWILSWIDCFRIRFCRGDKRIFQYFPILTFVKSFLTFVRIVASNKVALLLLSKYSALVKIKNVYSYFFAAVEGENDASSTVNGDIPYCQ